MQPAIEVSGLTKRYGEGDAAVDALKGVDMIINPGEVVGLIGPSGSGKSTLLKCLGAVLVLVICAFASIVAIRAALRVDPATAIGG